MPSWPPKDPAETVAYTDDWTAQLGGPGDSSDWIASYTVVTSASPAGSVAATIIQQTLCGNLLTFLIAGGADASTTEFVVTVTTRNGQILERSHALYVADGQSSWFPTTTSKRQLVDQMFAECGINAWEFDIDPGEKDAALTRLDGLMWELRGRGYELGYNFPTAIGAGSLNDDLGCGDQAFFGLATLGAARLCPTMGKSLSRESREALNAAMKAVRAAAPPLVPSMQFAYGTAAGAGNKPRSRFWPFM
jgi:hypothetical protein